jgi:hypothetical protein
MSDDLDALTSWARRQGEKRHERLVLSSAAADGAAHVFQVLYESTIMVAFAGLRAGFEAAVKQYNEGCGFPDVRVGYSDIKPKVIHVERRHAPRFTLTIDVDKPRGAALRATCFTPDADLYRTAPPSEMFIALTIDSTLTRIVLERPAYAEVQRVLTPVLTA